MSFEKRDLCAVCGTLVEKSKSIKVKIGKKSAVVCSENCRSQWERIWKS